MPDLTQQTAWTCASNLEWSARVASASSLASYEVRWGPTPSGEAQYGWSCECPGWRIRKRCRHVTETEISGSRCCWNSELDPAVEPVIDGDRRHCPACDGPVEAVSVAV